MKHLLPLVILLLILLPIFSVTEVEQESKHTVTLTWVLSTCDNPAYQTMYRKHSYKNAKWIKVGLNLPNTEVSWTDTHVVSGLVYYYYVTVTDMDGNESDPSDIVEVTIPNP